MTIWHLRLFLSVAETGSMSAAAARHSVRQPTVSQKIAELEHYYGVLLFERLGNRLRITESGERLVPLARDAVARFDDLEDFLRGERGASRLRIGATVTIGGSIFPQIIEAYRRAQPRTELYAYIDNTAVICRKLLANELDLGFVEGQVHEPELVAVPRIHDELVLACGNGHPFFEATELSCRALEGQSFVMREPGSGTRELFEQYLRKHRLTIRTVIETGNLDVMRSAIRVNRCLAVISARLLEQEAMGGSVRLFRCREAEWEREFCLVWHKNKHRSAAMRAFEHVIEEFLDPAPALQNLMRPLTDP